jgi:hypothetical protein
MADDDWYKPHRPPAPPRQPKPGEPLFEFLRGQRSVSLRAPRRRGIWRDGQFYQNEEILIGRRFEPRMDAMRTPREMAIAWAEEERKALESDHAND